jgi:DNA invertase Pin-like site-specific DNA recombinase
VRVFLYLRTSTDQQDESPQIQERRAREYCGAQGWDVVGVYYEIGSGTTPINRRPQFTQMIQAAPGAGVSGFVALTYNRFLRSTAVAAQMEALLGSQGLFIYGVDDKMAMGRLPTKGRMRAGERAMMNVQVVMDQYYSDSVSDKVRDHHEHRVAIQLHHSGPPPFGYRVGKDAFQVNGRWYDGWVPDDEPDGTGQMTVAERVVWIFVRFLACENLMTVACELTALGVPTPRLVQWNRLTESEKARRLEIRAKNQAAGHEVMQLPPSATWDSSVLSDMLRSKAYLGMLAYTPDAAKVPGKQKVKEWHEGRHAALLTPELHASVAAILDQRHQAKRKPPTPGTEAMLTAMLLCGCGHAMTRSPKGQDTNVFRYCCNLRKKSRGQACQTASVNSRLVDQVVLRLLLRGLQARASEVRAAAARAGGDGGRAALATEREQLAGKRDRVLANYEDGLYGEGPAAKAERDTRLSPVLRRLAELDVELAPATAKAREGLDAVVAQLRATWDGLPVEAKREVLRAYVPDGFRLLPGRRLRAEVCGVTLEAAIPENEPTRPGVKYGGRKRGATN